MSTIGRRDFLINAMAIGTGCTLSMELMTENSLVQERRRYNTKTGATTKDHVGQWFKSLEDGSVQCTLCPLMENLKDGKRGACRVRYSKGGKLYVTNYGKPAALHMDPIEKNPIYHFIPGTKTLALATAGCNLACPACQNWEMSQRAVSDIKNYNLSPTEAVHHAKKNGCKGFTFTFTEPIIFFEYLVDIACEAKRQNLSNHIVTGGYINPEPLGYLCKFIDSFSVSIKGEKDYAYGNRPLVYETIKNTLKIIKSQNIWLEVAVLVTPSINDSDNHLKELSRWLKTNLGEFTPVHFSRFYPAFKLENIPQTPVPTLENARKIAIGEGLKYVYIGNVPGHNDNNTFCHNCKRMLVQRVGFRVLKNETDRGKCSYCGAKIPGILS